jgi:galactokinase
LNLAVDTALKFGALGSRMIGGGFGGSAIALIKAKDTELIKGEIKNSFMKARFKSPSIAPIQPGLHYPKSKRNLKKSKR